MVIVFMKKIFSILNSRQIAVSLLTAIVALLILSTFLPNEITRAPEEWDLLARRQPLFFRLASTLSTPYLVKQWWFVATAFFLFLATLTCTATRLNGWRQGRKSEFSKEKAFTFSADGSYAASPETVGANAARLLKKGRWDCSQVSRAGESLVIAAEKGIALGFWGSLVFHAGLLLCFIAIPLSAFYSFSGNLLLTQGAVVTLREGVRPDSGADPGLLPAGTVSVEDLRGVYLQGKFKLDFGGTLLLDRDGRAERLPFSVNQSVSSGGFQFSLQEYGFAPRLVVTREGLAPFDYFLNLTHPEEGDYFPLPEDGLRLFVVLLPDFFRDKNKIGSRSKEPRNPYLLVKVFQGEKVLVERLVKVGETVVAEGYSIAAPQLGNWVNLAVSRERGLIFIIFGSLVVTLGLLVRFLSNERRLELEILPAANGCTCRLKGYSRYYPAFLENEVVGFQDKLKQM
jgi:hypothetical protein